MSTRAVTFDFSTGGDWAVSGDAEIASGSFRLTDPFFMAPFGGVRHWSPAMPVGADYVGTPASGQVYYMMNGSSSPTQLGVSDGMFVFWMYYNANVASTKKLAAYCRYNVSLTATHFDVEFVGNASGDCELKLRNDAGALVADDSVWDADMPQNNWREFAITCLGTACHVRMGGKRDFWYRSMDLPDAGPFAFYSDDPGTMFRIGADTGEADHPGTKPAPYLCVRHIGAVEMATAAPYPIPEDVTSLRNIAPKVSYEWMVTHDTISGATNFTAEQSPIGFHCPLQYRIGAGGWTAVSSDGDLSGIASPGGQNIWFRIDDGSGTGLDNAAAMRWRPVVHNLLMSEVGTQATGQAFITRRTKPLVRRRD